MRSLHHITAAYFVNPIIINTTSIKKGFTWQGRRILEYDWWIMMMEDMEETRKMATDSREEKKSPALCHIILTTAITHLLYSSSKERLLRVSLENDEEHDRVGESKAACARQSKPLIPPPILLLKDDEWREVLPMALEARLQRKQGEKGRGP